MNDYQLHVWINSISGYIFTSSNRKPTLGNKGGKSKYMGWTYDDDWPKTMSTGRVLYMDTPRNEFKRKRKNSKKSKKPH